MSRLFLIFILPILWNQIYSQSEIRLQFYFNNNTSEINEEHKVKLKERLDALSKNEKILILGYANKLGDEEYNLELSRKRAETIRDFLIASNYPETNIELRYFGETQTIDKPEAEKEFRRVDFVITSEENENRNLFQPDDTPQEFAIDARFDTTIVCKKGTKIFIKAGTLINTSTGELAEKVTIKVQEYVSVLDFIEKGLTTRSDGRPLESGGMINVEALENNQQVAIRKGKNIKVSMPCNDCSPGMKTFYGERVKGDVNWKQTAEKPGKVISRKTLPIFAEGKESLKHFIQQNRRYPTKAFSKGVEGTVKIKFIISENGEVLEPKLEKGIESSLDKEAMRIVELMPKWTPAMLDGAAIESVYSFSIPFKITQEPFGKYNITSIGGDMSDYLIDNATDSAQKTKEYQEAMLMKKEAQAIVDYGYYVITSANLGWINCDRFNPNQLTSFIVDANTIDFVKVYLIMKRQKSLFRDEFRTNSKFNFRQIGLNEEVYVLAIKSDKGQLKMSLKEANTSQKSVLMSDYKDSDIEEVKRVIASIQPK